jgi:FkbM family methyltransferase
MLQEIKDRYSKGEFDKDRYYREMFKTHKHLFEYPALINNSPIKKIEIDSNQVTFNISNKGKDIKICCDERDAHALPMTYLNFRAYEVAEMDVTLKLIKPGDVIFDVGANIGWYTLNILLNAPGSNVYSFEPIKSSHDLLIKNLALNGQNTDRVYNFGFSDENKSIKFYFDIDCAMASSMVNLRESGGTIAEECVVKRMDDFVKLLASFNKLDFIKCDVEGAEYLVFKGGLETINKYKPVIFSEMLRKWAKKFDYHPNDIIKLLGSVNYECYIINNDKIEKFNTVDEDTVQTNYLFFHKDKHADIVSKLISGIE